MFSYPPATDRSLVPTAINGNRQGSATVPELLPWQAVLMILCLTAAGLMHDHAGLLRPLATRAHAVSLGMRADLSSPAAPLHARGSQR